MAPGDGQEKEGISHHFPPFLHVLCPGEHLRICPQEYTCCSSEIEQRLTWETEATFRGLVEENGSFLVHTLAARHRKFDGEELAPPNLASYLLSELMTPTSFLYLLLTQPTGTPAPV